MTISSSTPPPVSQPEVPKKRKLTGREFYEFLGSPTTIVAPMVEQSELAWRLLSRQHAPSNTLCYTPMFHSRLFSTSPLYRQQSFQPHLDCTPIDRPTFVQFCSNEPSDLLSAALLVQDHCDAVDLNLGCPQGIARKGHYGAFLQEEWELIKSLISTLATNLSIPVTAKIRILESKERSLEYAQMVVSAGASILTVHGRTREQKGHNTGIADWDTIKFIRDHIPREIVMFANGNILWQEDIPRCLEYTGVDGIMSAEGNLYNPAIFLPHTETPERRFPRMDKMSRQYFDIIKSTIIPTLPIADHIGQKPTKKSRKQLEQMMSDPSLTAIKSHLFKLWHTLLPRHTHIRDLLARAAARYHPTDILDSFEKCQTLVEEVIAAELATNPEAVDENGNWLGPDKPLTSESQESGEGIKVEIRQEDGSTVTVLRNVPWYRCQPYYRPLPEEALAKGALTAPTKEGKEKDKGRGNFGEIDEGVRKRVKLEPVAVVESETAEGGQMEEAACEGGICG
ncbi:tRNA dihydrouridine synthase [Rhizina undulata]